MTTLHEIYFIKFAPTISIEWMKRFHAHIYFETKDLELADALFARARNIDFFQSVSLHLKPIGPHPLAMIEVHFSEATLTFAIAWLEAQRGVFPTLIHEDTGDDHRDHTEGIKWLGKKLSLDFTFFELVKLRPEIAIHSKVTT